LGYGIREIDPSVDHTEQGPGACEGLEEGIAIIGEAAGMREEAVEVAVRGRRRVEIAWPIHKLS
jgi:hypothetical protein